MFAFPNPGLGAFCGSMHLEVFRPKGLATLLRVSSSEPPMYGALLHVAAPLLVCLPELTA